MQRAVVWIARTMKRTRTTPWTTSNAGSCVGAHDFSGGIFQERLNDHDKHVQVQR